VSPTADPPIIAVIVSAIQSLRDTLGDGSLPPNTLDALGAAVTTISDSVDTHNAGAYVLEASNTAPAAVPALRTVGTQLTGLGDTAKSLAQVLTDAYATRDQAAADIDHAISEFRTKATPLVTTAMDQSVVDKIISLGATAMGTALKAAATAVNDMAGHTRDATALDPSTTVTTGLPGGPGTAPTPPVQDTPPAGTVIPPGTTGAPNPSPTPPAQDTPPAGTVIPPGTTTAPTTPPAGTAPAGTGVNPGASIIPGTVPTAPTTTAPAGTTAAPGAVAPAATTTDPVAAAAQSMQQAALQQGVSLGTGLLGTGSQVIQTIATDIAQAITHGVDDLLGVVTKAEDTATANLNNQVQTALGAPAGTTTAPGAPGVPGAPAGTAPAPGAPGAPGAPAGTPVINIGGTPAPAAVPAPAPAAPAPAPAAPTPGAVNPAPAPAPAPPPAPAPAPAPPPAPDSSGGPVIIPPAPAAKPGTGDTDHTPSTPPPPPPGPTPDRGAQPGVTGA